jgi:hypothetical protein
MKKDILVVIAKVVPYRLPRFAPELRSAAQEGWVRDNSESFFKRVVASVTAGYGTTVNIVESSACLSISAPSLTAGGMEPAALNLYQSKRGTVTHN